jgi:hypothetical protein
MARFVVRLLGISLQIECTPYFVPLLLAIADEVIE